MDHLDHHRNKIMAFFAMLALMFGLSAAPAQAISQPEPTVPQQQNLAATLGVATASAVGSGINLKSGKYHTISGSWHAGPWIYAGKRVYCIRYNERFPDGSVTSASYIPGTNPSVNKRLKYIINTYGNSNDRNTAAAVSIAANILVNNAKFNADLPGYWRQLRGTNVQSVAKRMLAESLADITPQLTVKLSPVYAGQIGNGQVKLSAGTDIALAGRGIAFRTSGATVLPSKIKSTNAKGVLNFRFQRISNDEVTIVARAYAPNDRLVGVNRPSRGHQVALFAAAPKLVQGSASFNGNKINISTMTNDCDTRCDGKNITVSFTVNAPTGVALRWTITPKSGPISLDSAGGKIVLTAKNQSDGSKIAESFCVLDRVGGKCISPQINLGTREVICPPWPEMTLKVLCPSCGEYDLTALLPSNGLRFYQLTVQSGEDIKTYSLDGKFGIRIVLKPGESLKVGSVVYHDAARTNVIDKRKLIDFRQN